MLIEFSHLLSLLNWRQPLWLMIVFVPFFLWLILVRLKKNNQELFADKKLLPWLQVNKEKTRLQLFFSRNTAYIVAWVLLSLAMAGPRVPDTSVKNKDEILMNVMVVIDLSQSMQAKDIKPSRIRRAVLETYEFLTMVSNARVGVIVYAARAHLLVPLTSDVNAVKFYINDLDTLQLPTRGSNPLAAIKLAKKELDSNIDDKKKDDKKKIILWLTDVDIEEKEMTALEEELSNIKQDNIDTYLLSLATEAGAAIPLIDGGWLERQGLPIISTKKNIFIDRMIKMSNIRASQVQDDNADWAKLYFQGMRNSLSALKQEKNQWKELFSWGVLPAIFLLLIALFPIRLWFKKTSNVTLNIVVCCFLFVWSVKPAPIYAFDAYYDVTIIQGIEAYKSLEFVKAKQYFISSVLNAKTDKERAVALHNLGNTLFQIKDYARATDVFTDALRYAPKQQESIKNQELSLALFIELQKRRNRKMNKGNFAAADDLAPLSDLPEQLPFMLSTKAVNLLKAKLPKIPMESLDRFLLGNIEDLSLLQGDNKLMNKNKERIDIEQARLFFMGQEEENSNALWKRLFEIEEGFPGKLKAPEIIPGIQPW